MLLASNKFPDLLLFCKEAGKGCIAGHGKIFVEYLMGDVGRGYPPLTPPQSSRGEF